MGYPPGARGGSGYIAGDTRAIARSLGLKPVTTPVCSPQSNGMAESFVNLQARLRQPHEPGGRHDGHGAVARGIRALQQRASALAPEDAIAQGIQATSTARRPDRERVNQRVDRVRLCGGKTSRRADATRQSPQTALALLLDSRQRCLTDRPRGVKMTWPDAYGSGAGQAPRTGQAPRPSRQKRSCGM